MLFYVLLEAFLHLRRKLGGPVSALVTDVGKFVCLWVCSNFYSNVYKSVASASFSKSLKYRKKKKTLCGHVMLCCASLWSRGRFVGFPFPSWANSSQLQQWKLGWQCAVLCGWRKENVSDSSWEFTFWLEFFCFVLFLGLFYNSSNW